MESIVAKLDAALYPAVCSVNTYLSNYILVFLLVAVGLWYSIKTRFVQVRCFGEGMRRVFGNLTLNGKKHDSGMSSFQALATAIAAQVGTGNIVGASGAILTGGPGAIFWMWVIAFFGMATIYAEATLAIKTRIKAADGTIHGGPVYYITTAFKGGFGKFLATFFAVAIILALGFMGCMVQSNSIGECFQTAFGIPSWIVGVVLVVIFTDLPGFFGVLRGLEAILEPLILGAVFAFLLNPIVRFVDTRLGPLLGAKTKWKAQAVRNVSRGAGVVTAVIVAALILYAFFSMLLPQLYESVVGIVDNAENYYTSIDRWVTNVLEDNPEIQGYVDSALGKIYEFINNWITTTFLQDVQKLLATVTTSVVAVVKSLMNVLIGLVASVYILWSKETFQAQGKKIIVAAFSRKGADHIFYLGRNIYRVFNGFVIGKIVDSAIIGVLCYIGILILKMPYPALIATVIGVTNVIPFFGPIIGLVPCAFLILLVNPLQAFYFVIFILVLQQVDGNVIGPKILGNTVGISGFWVLASITIAASLFGFTGMILGVPVFAILYLLISDSVNEKLRKKSLTTDTRAYRDIQTVDELPKTEETGEK